MTFIPKESRFSSGAVPIGGVFAYAGNGLPKTWLLCDGSAYAFTQAAATTFGISMYKHLYDVIGQTYAPSVAEGVTLDLQGKFMVPNLIGRFATGIDNSGSVIGEVAPLAGTGGQQFVTLDFEEMPEHSHYFVDYYQVEVDRGGRELVTVDAFGDSFPERFGNRKSDNDNRPVSSFWNRTGTSVWYERFGGNGPTGDNPRFENHNLSSLKYQDDNFTSPVFEPKWYIPPFGGKDGGGDEEHNNTQAFLALKYLIKAEELE